MDNFKSGELAIIQQIGAVVPFIQNTLQEKVSILFVLSTYSKTFLSVREGTMYILDPKIYRPINCGKP